jgi:immune inhibitor A
MSFRVSLRRLGFMLSLVSLLFAACSNPGSQLHHVPSEANATPPPGLKGSALTAWHVLHDARPARDLTSLALRLKHVAGPIPTVTRSAPLNEQVGAEDRFWVLTSRSTYKQITARLVYFTPHVYDYVEDGVTLDMSTLRASADLFENTFYPADRRYFGSERTPGVDDDVHVTILNAPDLRGDVSGYFSNIDEYPTSVAPFSNQREMIYVRSGSDPALAPNADAYNETLTSEFQRMIHWRMHPADPAWVDFGMSVLAQHLNGYITGSYDGAFFGQPDTQLDTWSLGDDAARHDGAAYLFIDYFAEHYGGYEALTDLLEDPAQVPLNFDDVLAENGFSDRFDDVFAKWVMTNAVNNIPQMSDPAYFYKTVAHESATLQHTVAHVPYANKGAVQQYAAQYYDVNAPAGAGQTLDITFAGQPSVPLISADQPAPGGAFWWSNRGDNIDTTLTRTVDLTQVKGQQATLNFSLWYDLEAGYDYGYVEVSTDGGKLWYPLPIQGVPSGGDPNGLNYGNGVTGSRNGTSWVPVSVDLSAYIGKKIQVRFESITDDVVNQQGMAVANVSIPQIGFSDTAQSDSGWNRQGWLRVDSALPERYIVQAALFDDDGSFNRVVIMQVSGDGQGKLTIPDFGSQVNRAIIAVSALAPATTLPASYTINVS